MPAKGMTLIGAAGIPPKAKLFYGTLVKGSTTSCGAAARTSVGTVTITGGNFGDLCLVGSPSNQPTSLLLQAEVTAQDTVTVYGLNPTAGALNAVAGTYKVYLLKITK